MKFSIYLKRRVFVMGWVEGEGGGGGGGGTHYISMGRAVAIRRVLFSVFLEWGCVSL